MKTGCCLVFLPLLLACGNGVDDSLTSVDSIQSALLSKECRIDSQHWASVDARLSGTTMIGYTIRYNTIGGWRLGTSSNEHVSASGHSWYDSPDHCSPNTNCYRDIPNRRATDICIQAVFDKDGDDPRCTICY